MNSETEKKTTALVNNAVLSSTLCSLLAAKSQINFSTITVAFTFIYRSFQVSNIFIHFSAVS